MTTLLFDIETNGLLPELDRLHSLVIKDVDTGVVLSCHDVAQGDDPSIASGLSALAVADVIIGHNVIKFDVPAIQKVYPRWKPAGVVRDTLLLSRLQFPEIKEGDFKRNKRGQLPGNLIGSYSLAAWGHRLTEYKGDYKGGWERWSPEMQDYCEQDVEVTHALWQWLQRRPYSPEAVELEHAFQQIIFMMEEEGFPFDEQEAAKLYAKLRARFIELEAGLRAAFPPWYRNRGHLIPKRDNKARGYVEGAPLTKVDLTPLNPASRDELSDRLQRLRGWKPKEFTTEGKPKLDEAIVSKLPWPEAALINEYLMVGKRIGQLAEGKQAWLKCSKGGLIHGGVITAGAVTRRCTHSRPNVAQTPSVSAPYGEECRALWGPGLILPGYAQVGADASGIELRCLAHYMARYDGGAYGKALLEGDVHWQNALAMGVVQEAERDKENPVHTILREKCAKTFVYAFLYGCGDEKAGAIVYNAILLLKAQGLPYEDLMHRFFETTRAPGPVALKKAGKRIKTSFLAKTPALKRLREDIDTKVRQKGYILAIDRGMLHVRSPHAALNTLLQSAGAIAVKKATVLFYDYACSSGYVWGRGNDWWLCGHIHDEVQSIAKQEIADELGQLAVRAFRDAGPALGFRCPLDGAYKVGRNWAECH